MYPGRNGQKSVVHTTRSDYLHANWETMRPCIAGQRHRWRVEQGPHAVEERIACRVQSCRCFPWCTWHQQDIVVGKNGLQPAAACFSECEGIGIRRIGKTLGRGQEFKEFCAELVPVRG